MREPKRLEVGVDWFTASARLETEQSERIWAYGREMAQARNKQGIYPEEARVLGFSGWTSGTSVFWGQSKTHTMLRVTGGDAAGAFQSVNRPGDHYTRLDICATVWLPPLPVAYHERLFNTFKKTFDPDKSKSSGPRIVMDGRAGWCVYSGERTAKQMARIYNKGAESQDPAFDGAIRYELELKDKYATEMANMLVAQGERYERYLLAFLKMWFRRKGVNLPYDAQHSEINLLSIPHEETTTERQLAWLEHQVRPTVQRLLTQGLEEYVRILLFGAEGANERPDAVHKGNEV